MAIPKYRRMELLAGCQMPTVTEVRKQMGSPLSELFFKSVSDETNTMIGMIPLLKGVETKDLWLSPSDILIGKIMLTPPMPTRRVVRALTHEGINEIGDRVIYKIENEHRIDKELALLELRAYLEAVAKAERERAVEEAREEERLKQDKMVQELLEQCREDMAIAIDETEQRLDREMAVQIQGERQEVNELLNDQMMIALQREREMLVKHFTTRMVETIKELNDHYAFYIGGIVEHFHWRLRLIIHQNEQNLLQLRMRLESQNECDVSYAVCRERQRCKAEKERIQEEYELQIEELTKFIEMKILELEQANEYYEDQVYNNAQWKLRVRDIVREFQKFINFSLRAVPGQAQFLLSLEKLLILEMLKPATVVKEQEEIAVEESVPRLKDVSTTMTKSADILSSMLASGSLPLDVGMAMEGSVGDYDLRSEGEEVSNYMYDEMKTSGENVVTQVIQNLIKAATPLTTEDIVYPILEGIVNEMNLVSEGEEIVIPIVDSIFNHASEMKEGDEIALMIVDSIFNHVAPEMFEVSTQVPSIVELVEEEHDPNCDPPVVHSRLRNSLEDEEIITESKEPLESIGKTHLLSKLKTDLSKASVASKQSQECAWCEIKNRKTISVCYQNTQPELKVGPQPIMILSNDQSIASKTSSKNGLIASQTKPSVVEKFANARPLMGKVPSNEIETLVSARNLQEDQTFQERGLVGEGGAEHEQNPEEFVQDRLQSLLTIFKNHPSLTQAFTR